METRATAKIKIKTIPEVVKTIKVYQKALQFCINFAWKHKIRNKIKLQYAIYTNLKKRRLHAQLIVCCCRQAVEMVKKAETKPIIKRTSIRYNFPRSASLKNNVLSLSTLKGRVKIPFSIPDCYRQYFNDWKLCESLLRMDKKGRCFFMFNFAKDIKAESSCLQNRVLGIDVGINNLAVTSDRKFYGKDMKQLRIKHDKLVSQLQAKGTKSAKRKLKRMSGRWKRFMAWTNHTISKRIVESVREGSVIVMEDLSFIRKTAKYNKWVHKWAFRQLQSFIDYKAVRKGCRIVYINPAYTSQECNICHNIVIRHNGFVECLFCSHSLNSDLSGSRNIAQRYMRNMCLASVTTPYISNVEGKASFDELSLSLGIKAHSL